MRHGMSSGWRRNAATGLLCALAGLLSAGLAAADDTAATKPLPPETLTALKRKVIPESAAVYIRIFKEESELEVWSARADGRYIPIKTFPICNWSGALGPKQALGDHMAPEGFYSLSRDSLKPDSKYHLALNIGYPNTLDRALGRTGDFIMVHGKCVSVGCFAMTDDLIEEVYAFVRDALDAGQETIPVHIFPFRMTAENWKAHADHPAHQSWAPLKEAFDDFAKTREPPRIGICAKHYVVNPIAAINTAAEACPVLVGKRLAPVSPKTAKKLAGAGTPIIAEGVKTHSLDGSIASASTATWMPAFMLGLSLSATQAESQKAKPASRDAGLQGRG